MLAAVSYKNSKPLDLPCMSTQPMRESKSHKSLVGIDIFLQWQKGKPEQLGTALNKMSSSDITLQLITNRGVKVWPEGFPETFCVDHWRCRFMASSEPLCFTEVLALQARLHDAGFDVVKTENLYNFDNEPGYAAVHG